MLSCTILSYIVYLFSNNGCRGHSFVGHSEVDDVLTIQLDVEAVFDAVENSGHQQLLEARVLRHNKNKGVCVTTAQPSHDKFT